MRTLSGSPLQIVKFMSLTSYANASINADCFGRTVFAPTKELRLLGQNSDHRHWLAPLTTTTTKLQDGIMGSTLMCMPTQQREKELFDFSSYWKLYSDVGRLVVSPHFSCLANLSLQARQGVKAVVNACALCEPRSLFTGFENCEARWRIHLLEVVLVFGCEFGIVLFYILT